MEYTLQAAAPSAATAVIILGDNHSPSPSTSLNLLLEVIITDVLIMLRDTDTAVPAQSARTPSGEVCTIPHRTVYDMIRRSTEYRSTGVQEYSGSETCVLLLLQAPVCCCLSHMLGTLANTSEYCSSAALSPLV